MTQLAHAAAPTLCIKMISSVIHCKLRQLSSLEVLSVIMLISVNDFSCSRMVCPSKFYRCFNVSFFRYYTASVYQDQDISLLSFWAMEMIGAVLWATYVHGRKLAVTGTEKHYKTH